MEWVLLIQVHLQILHKVAMSMMSLSSCNMVISTERELNGWIAFQQGAAHHEINQNARLEVQDFYGDNNPKVFLDWVHNMDALFRWYDISECCKF